MGASDVINMAFEEVREGFERISMLTGSDEKKVVENEVLIKTNGAYLFM